MTASKGSRWIVLTICLLPFLLCSAPAARADAPPPDAPYLAGLIATARERRLADDPYWRTLLHYKRSLFGGRSLVDDPDFFLAPDGRHDPGAELEATLRALFAPPPEEGKAPVCRFVARYAWLREQLGIDPARLPLPTCEALDGFIERVQPAAATLIFPTAHMNSPASMYGHTLLTIETESGSKLLAYAVNYAAVTNETFGPLYILKGVLGRYEGYFSILPYYAKLQEYSDVNDRDIWEYPLNLDRDEVRRLLYHLYEMEGIYSHYYFFKENCSYDLLFLLEAARPGVRLTDRFRWWVIPLDTIRAVRDAGLAGDAIYRPSKSTKVRHMAAPLSGAQRKEALALADGAVDAVGYAARDDVPAGERIAVLDLATEVLQYRYAKHAIAQEPYQQLFLPLLTARSGLGGAEEEPAIPAPPRPDLGHRSNRIALAGGVTDGKPFQEYRLRPAYHDLLDDDRGYLRGSQIVFGETALRYHPRRDRLELESLNLIDIASIAPRDAFFKPTSWKVRTGFFRRTFPDRSRRLIYDLNTGFGLAGSGRATGLVWGLIETDTQVGGALDRNFSIGAGASAGLLRDIVSGWKLELRVRDIYYGWGDGGNVLTAGVGQNVSLGADAGLGVNVDVERAHDRSRFTASLGWNIFF